MPLDHRTLGELEAAAIRSGEPLVVVDADEVLVHFADDFEVWVRGRGVRFELTEYSLDTALRDEDGQPLTRERIEPLLHAFIAEETHRQRAVDGAAEALGALAREAQVVVLTNAPLHVREQRIGNLGDHGMTYPVVINEGGKGPALDWLRRRAAAPVAFVDDSPRQLKSAAEHADPVARLHLVGSDIVRRVVAPSDHAHHHPQNWTECGALIRRALRL